MKIIIPVICIFFTAVSVAQPSSYTSFVNPMIGTDGTGHTFPGATVPFGLVQLSPETGFAGWDYCSGYRYADKKIYGFSHTHLSGTGAKDLGDILMMPFTGTPGDTVVSTFSHDKEKASPGYYAVELDDYNIKAAFTATAHAGLHQYSYPSADKVGIVINLKAGLVNKIADLETHVLESAISLVDSHTLSGYTITRGWAGKQHVHFVIRAQQPITSHQWLSDSAAGRNHVLALYFGAGNAFMQQIKVAISTVSTKNAVENLEAEIPHWDFARVKQEAALAWESRLSKIQIEGSKAEKEIFYSAMYHSFIAPNNIADVNGQYRGADNEVHHASNKVYYSTLSLWDTFRALNPLFTIILPEETKNIVRSMLAHDSVQGYLPIWTLWGHENYCMIGNHAIPTLAEAYVKGICTDNIQQAVDAVRRSSMVDHKGSDWTTYLKHGYYPSDITTREAVSKTLESSYDDYAVAKLAALSRNTQLSDSFMKRASFYQTLFDKETAFMRGRNADGSWVQGFDPFKLSHAGTAGGDYTEGNAWQYTWHVQHDIPGLIALMGGKQAFLQKLDSLFEQPSHVYGDGSTLDVTGLIGQYAHGNEPCHHVAYLYTLAGQPWKTADRISQIIPSFYTNKPDGLSGNDDCGQMSAWYIFSSLGFYPVDPVSATYVFGRPLHKKSTIRVGEKSFVINAKGLDANNKYIQQILLNGKQYHSSSITHADLVKGGELTFIMGNKQVDYTREIKK
ncbi:GH92 family glycosyl hydrolase [Terrimonas sp. NA20]|uniref:GH92 family glycosyl hydrolase n=1 Tax=Terrimonas ginsenosidimutans TaxID=2908004 RepID=A0ABS9KMH4_9BACT|nr:GH92 family glycosyl hydrolase [Terrimonas ginsenosidimutans]MCG2613525.1 GH92 family glycosyl hydrolase [Terrimonas ginsenosidimutans]